MTFLFVTMQNLSQNNYIYDDVLIYDEINCSLLIFLQNQPKLIHYKIMMFFWQ
jgi:hypothetical protein